MARVIALPIPAAAPVTKAAFPVRRAIDLPFPDAAPWAARDPRNGAREDVQRSMLDIVSHFAPWRRAGLFGFLPLLGPRRALEDARWNRSVFYHGPAMSFNNNIVLYYGLNQRAAHGFEPPTPAAGISRRG
jgi:hypothetical protein